VAGKTNVVFCDGHVESPELQFLFADTSAAALSRWNRDHNPTVNGWLRDFVLPHPGLLPKEKEKHSPRF
jgi:prepilin-type processing-associated H-X9-DG protein